MLVLTDDTGMAQHASHGTPDLGHGYCTDDNARALIAGVMAMRSNGMYEPCGTPGACQEPGRLTVALQRYLAFLNYAFDADRGRFRNFMSFDRRWLEESGSQDSHARALWGLGAAAAFARKDGIAQLAQELFQKAMVAVDGFGFIRPLAYSALGIRHYLRACPGDVMARSMAERVGNRLLKIWQASATCDWPWWEERLTWGNAKLPHALLELGMWLGRNDMIDPALNALRWLLREQTAPDGHLSVVGNHGWYPKGGKPARFDQQPIEAKALIQACLAAADATGQFEWFEEARRCFQWFLGGNDLGLSLYNAETGGCYEGLRADGVNENQGSESTLAYILSLLELHMYQKRCAGLAMAEPSA